MKTISIIVPVYQSEAYIADCLISLLKQNLENYEILCIDDGSKDASANIINEFRKTNSQIRYYYQKNQGVSAARNKGMELAQGEYLMFVDSDDTIRVNSLKYLYYKMQKTGADILVFGGQADNPLLTPEWVKDALFTRNKIYINDSLNALFHENGAKPSVCNKLFTKKILSGAVFPINISVSEIWLFCLQYFLELKR